MKIWTVIAELLGTDGEYSTEVYPVMTGQGAGELASSLVAEVAEMMGVVTDVDPTVDWELEGAGGNWFYRVRIQEDEIGYDDILS